VPVHKDAPLAEFERMAPRFPVFRLVPRSNSREEGGVTAHKDMDGGRIRLMVWALGRRLDAEERARSWMRILEKG
jgi:hypothetical protein